MHPRSSPRLLIFALLAAITLLAIPIGFILDKKSDPLGPSLQLPTLANTPTAVAAPAPTSTIEAQPEPLERSDSLIRSVELPTPTALAAKKPVCGGPESMLVLGIGADSSTYLYGLADVIRVARLDFINEKITVVSLPRDLWVEIPGISERYGYTHGKLNQAYFFGSPGMGYVDVPAGGPYLLALTLQHNFGLSVDHYAAANLEVFARIVDALGGVDIDLPYEINDIGGYTDLYFAPGQHHLDGKTAIQLARIRYFYDDFQRQDNQSLVIAALRKKVLSPSVLPRIPALIDAFKDQVLTDLSPEQILQAVCLLGKVDSSEIVQTQLPAELYDVGWTYSHIMGAKTSIVSADPQEITGYLTRFAAGQWP